MSWFRADFLQKGVTLLLSVTWKTLPVKDYFKINFFELCKQVCTHKFSGWYYPLSLNATVERRKKIPLCAWQDSSFIHLYRALAFGVPHSLLLLGEETGSQFLLLGMLRGQDLGVLSCASHPTQSSNEKPWYHQGWENLRTKARTGAGLSARIPPFMFFQVPVGSPISCQFSSFFRKISLLNFSCSSFRMSILTCWWTRDSPCVFSLFFFFFLPAPSHQPITHSSTDHSSKALGQQRTLCHNYSLLSHPQNFWKVCLQSAFF